VVHPCEAAEDPESEAFETSGSGVDTRLGRGVSRSDASEGSGDFARDDGASGLHDGCSSGGSW
jgi:hypothetical protein